MMMCPELPSLEQTCELMQSLFGDETVVARCDRTFDVAQPAIVAQYADASGAARALVAFDLALANALGAALTRVPPRFAELAAKEGTVAANIYENLREVCNICVNLFSHHPVERLSLRAVSQPTTVSEAIGTQVGTVQETYCVQVEKYPSGCLMVGKLA